MSKGLYKYLPYLACFSAGLFSFFNLSQLALFNVIGGDLLSSFHLTSTQLGIFSGVYLLSNAIGLIPAGVLLDNYSARSIGLISMSITIIATIIIAQSSTYPLSVAMHAIQGLGSAMSLQLSLRMATIWFPQRTGVAIGLIIAFALSGGIWGDQVFTVLTNHLGWRNAVLIGAMMGVVFFCFMYFFLTDKHLKDINSTNLFCLKFVEAVTTKWQVLAIGFYIGLMNLPVFIITGLWGNLYLHQARGISSFESAFITSLLFLGVMIGSPIIGYFSDRLQNRRLPMILGALFSLPIILSIVFTKVLALLILACLFFALGFFISAQIVGYALIADKVSIGIRSTVTSIVALLENLVGAIGQLIFSFLVSLHWDHLLINQTSVYKNNAYTLALLIFPISFIVCLIISFFIEEKMLL